MIGPEGSTDVLAEIRDELKELPFIREQLEQLELLATIDGHLERIANEVQFALECYRGAPQKVEPGYQQAESSPQSVSRLELDARKTLQIIRAVLDEPGGTLPGVIGSALWEAEDLLSRALGNPIWEGRRK